MSAATERARRLINDPLHKWNPILLQEVMMELIREIEPNVAKLVTTAASITSVVTTTTSTT